MKNCLVSLRNKKLNNCEEVGEIVSAFSSAGYYFDNVTLAPFNSSEEIIRALNDGAENYDNLVVSCPKVMENTIEQYLADKLGEEFDDRGVLKTEKVCAFVTFSDGENKLSCRDIIAILDKRYDKQCDRTYIKTVGAPIDEINKAIAEAKKIGEVEFGVHDKFGDCTIEIVYSSTTPKMVVDEIVRSLLSSLKDYVYAMEDITLAERLYQLLKLRRMKISVAESFTGGGVCKKLVEVPGVSEVFFEGLNTYSNEAKHDRLGVKELTLKQNGAVSQETAYEMAAGLLATGQCDVSVATTGIAGPKSDNTLKPVGLIYIAVGTVEQISVYQYNLSGSREQITETAINLALFHTFKLLK